MHWLVSVQPCSWANQKPANCHDDHRKIPRNNQFIQAGRLLFSNIGLGAAGDDVLNCRGADALGGFRSLRFTGCDAQL